MNSSVFSFRHLGVALLTSFGIAAVVHCGGAVSEAPACPAQLTGACVSGDFCSEQTTNSCGSAVAVNCHCDSKGWTCDAPPTCKPRQCGPNGVFQGESCSAKGATCNTFVACAGGGFKGPGTVTCTCDGQAWQCPDIACPPPPQSCPPPGALHGGEPCYNSQTKDMICKSGPAYYDCDHNIEGYSDCSCQPTSSGSRWMCVNIGMPMCDDAGPPSSDASWVDASWADASWTDSGK